MLRIAICDDSHDQIEIIQKSANKYFSNMCEYNIDVFDNPLIFLESVEKNGGYDIVLLDICMPGIIGVDVAKEIRQRKDKTEIIFLTISDEFAVDAFALKAAHYIIKPFTQEKFNEAMDRATLSFFDISSKKLPVKTERGDVIIIYINDIIYIQSNGHNQIIYLENNDNYRETRRSLSRLLEELENLSSNQFIAPYKGYIVNQKYIATIDSKCIKMRNGVKIPLPRGTFRQIQKQYMDYRFREANKKPR